MLRTVVFTIFILQSFIVFSQQTATVYGSITNEKNVPLPEASVTILDKQATESADQNGIYSITIDAGDTAVLVFSHLGYEPAYKKVYAAPNTRSILMVQLLQSSIMIDTFTVRAKRSTEFIIEIPLEELEYIPYTVDPITAILTKVGASSNNELSSQYSVRGGNYDENLVYVNDFEIYRPLLVRSGQQEGLPFPNFDLIDKLRFSAGGFEAKYGDKLSSVLDIQYKQPKDFEAGVTASLLGASFYMNDISDSEKSYYLFGTRYKTNQYLLNSLNTKGQYEPVFVDVQGLVGFKLSEKSLLEVLGNFSYNSYTFLPQTRSTATGVVNYVVGLDVFFEGQETDEFTTGFGGISYEYQPTKLSSLKLLASAYRSLETETFDIIGDYWLGIVESNLGEEDFGDLQYGLGVGTFQNFARNYLDASVANIAHIGSWQTGNQFFEWGGRVQYEMINDELKEWEMLDSAGYSLPYTGEEVLLTEVFKANVELNSFRYSAHFQDTWEPGGKNFAVIGGLRSSYWDLNKELTVSPRFQAVWNPQWQRKDSSGYDLSFKTAAGIYHQPPFYRELRDLEGNLHTDVKSQKSIHFLLGSDYFFTMWKREFRFVTELYYKHLYDLIPYEVENVRIRYYGENSAKGYAAGIDLRLHGELVEDADSWISLSLLQTEENISGDSSYNVIYDSEGNVDSLVTVPQGFIPRPTDQLVNFGMFFQDYMPGNKNFKVHLSFLFGSGLPFGPPDNQYYRNALRIPPYRRVDIGFSALILDKNRDTRDSGWLKHFENIWVGVEVFNLLGIQNTNSYIWVKDINNLQYAFPNYLTDRRVNVRLVAKL